MEAKSHKLFTDQRHNLSKKLNRPLSTPFRVILLTDSETEQTLRNMTSFTDYHTFQSDPTDRLKDRTNTEKHNVLHGLSHLSEWSYWQTQRQNKHWETWRPSRIITPFRVILLTDSKTEQTLRNITSVTDYHLRSGMSRRSAICVRSNSMSCNIPGMIHT